MDNLWAGWRSQYVDSANDEFADNTCILCKIKDSEVDSMVLKKYNHVFVVMNAYPYVNGHVMVVPNEHKKSITDMSNEEANELMEVTQKTVEVIEKTYKPQGINMGANIGKAAGAGVPDHFHMHVLPRWSGDTNFTTSIANTRILPEPLEDSYKKLKENW